MKHLSQTRRTLFVAVAVVVIVVCTILALQFEPRVDTIDRLNQTAQTLPEFNGRVIAASEDTDGECEEISDSSSLPALRYIEQMSTEEFEDAKRQFVQLTEQQGIIWQSPKKETSNVFERDNKKYKIQLVRYMSPKGHFGATLTACN